MTEEPIEFEFNLNDEGELWAEMQCPTCWIDMDFELERVPKAGTLFECPGCQRDHVVSYDWGPGAKGAMVLHKRLAELEWQPIATAPHDGLVDVWSGGRRIADAFWRDVGPLRTGGGPGWYTEGEEYDDRLAGYPQARIEPQPSHWRPIPSAPDPS